MSLSAGDRLGPYEVLSPLGAGGMGEVYKARDTRLDRLVAIKLSQERFTDRFEREARAISALNHPNICQLYDVGPNYLIMEFVEGLPVAPPGTTRKLVDLAVQMADGLAAAHASGIVHRDLKPDNVLVTHDGRLKILDFGLATDARVASGADEAAPTVVRTDPGTVLGTVNYMSPEQARGVTPLTAQSDQFSLGLILYELATGQRAFRRDSAAETMAAIIRDEPEPMPASSPAPPPLRWIISRLLAKEPADRYDSTRDLYRELRQIRDRLSESATALETTPVSRSGARGTTGRWKMLGIGALAGVLVTALGAAIWATAWGSLAGGALAGDGATHDLANFRFTPVSTEAGPETAPAWSPDGKSLAYIMAGPGLPQVYIRTLESPEPVRLTSVEKGASSPAWSKDAATVYFLSDNSLWAVASTGGTPERLIEQASSYAGHPDGRTILFTRGPEIWRRLAGEDPQPFTPPAEFTALPGQRRLLGFSPDGTRLAGIVGDKLWVMPYPSGALQPFDIERVDNAGWMPDNRRLVLSQILSPQSHHLSILDTTTGTQDVFYVSPDTLFAAAVSPDGKRIAYSGGRIHWQIVEINLRDHRIRNLQTQSWYPRWSPSGTRYLFGALDGRKMGIDDATATDRFSRRVIDVDEGVATRPRWAHDATRFTFMHSSTAGERLMLANTSGARKLPLDATAPGTTRDAVWSPDDEFVVYARVVPQKEFQIARIRPGSSAGPEILRSWASGAAAQQRLVPVAWSPDGRQILARAEGSRSGLFVVSPDFKTERLLTSRSFLFDGVDLSNDGRSVLGVFRNGSGTRDQWQLWSVDVATGRETLVTTLDLPEATDRVAGFSLHPDGSRALTSLAVFPYDIWMLEGWEPGSQGP